MQDLDTARVIEEVAKRPCLWDNSVKSYKILKHRQQAWDEVTEAVVDCFEDMDVGDRFEMSMEIKTLSVFY